MLEWSKEDEATGLRPWMAGAPSHTFFDSQWGSQCGWVADTHQSNPRRRYWRQSPGGTGGSKWVAIWQLVAVVHAESLRGWTRVWAARLERENECQSYHEGMKDKSNRFRVNQKELNMILKSGVWVAKNWGWRSEGNRLNLKDSSVLY